MPLVGEAKPPVMADASRREPWTWCLAATVVGYIAQHGGGESVAGVEPGFFGEDPHLTRSGGNNIEITAGTTSDIYHPPFVEGSKESAVSATWQTYPWHRSLSPRGGLDRKKTVLQRRTILRRVYVCSMLLLRVQVCSCPPLHNYPELSSVSKLHLDSTRVLFLRRSGIMRRQR